MTGANLRSSTSLGRLGVIGIVGAMLLAGCGGGSTGSTSPGGTSGTTAPAATATPAPTPTAAPTTASATTSPTNEATGAPGAPDPCQMVSSSEASKLAGVTFGAGKEDTTSGNGRICVYGSSTFNVFSVVTALAPDTATAKAAESEFEASLSQAAPEMNAKVTQLPNWQPGVDAAVVSGHVTISGKTLYASAMYILKGTTFVGFSCLNLGTPAPSEADLEAQGLVVLGRI